MCTFFIKQRIYIWISCIPLVNFSLFTSRNGLNRQPLFVFDKISARIQKARLAYANLRHLWRRRYIHVQTKGRVYCTAVHFSLLYGCGTWRLSVEDICRLLVHSTTGVFELLLR